MKITIRAKLGIVVGTAALAFLVLIGTGLYLASRMDRELTQIQDRYIPILELGPRLQGGYERVRRGLQDSVAAQDAEALESNRAIVETLVEEIRNAGSVVGPERAAELAAAMEGYYSDANAVSRRLIAGETGETLVDAMNTMQSKHNRVSLLLRDVTMLDRGKLLEAFTAISKTQATNGRSLILISVICMCTVILLTFGLSRSILRSLSALSGGLVRFGQGDFSAPIQINSHDELEEVAKRANFMADRIRSLLKELEAFSYSVAHDLRAPLRGVVGFSNVVLEDYGSALPEEGKATLVRVVNSAKKMGNLIDSLLNLSSLARKEMKQEATNLSEMASGIIEDLRQGSPERKVDFLAQAGVIVRGDPQLLHIVLTNLLRNAWKFTGKRVDPRIEFASPEPGVYFVRDNGAGFDMQYAQKLFGTFQRLHTVQEFEGTGIGLATVQRIIHRHGGRIWAESKPDEGATFFFTLSNTEGKIHAKSIDSAG
ncbi:MAG: ATP-binding protein [Bacteriovoracia bacterium]